MILPYPVFDYFHYLMRRDADKFFIAIAIRSLAIGMISIFVPIYIYQQFHDSLVAAFLYQGLLSAIYSFVVIFAGDIITKFGTHKPLLASSILYPIYYLTLSLFPLSFWFVPASLIIGAFAMALFWPIFHVDFIHFSAHQKRGSEVGKVNIASIAPTVASPVIGGWILSLFGYTPLFLVVIMVMLTSVIPLLFTSETHVVYTDSVRSVWRKIFSREYFNDTVAFTSAGVEYLINLYVWPLFLFILAIDFSTIGAITAISLVAWIAVILYAGRLSDTADRPWLLNAGSLFTAFAWVLKFFVRTPLNAFSAQIIYKITRAAAGVPFQAMLYDEAEKQEEGGIDEFIIYREVAINGARFTFLMLCAALFFFIPTLHLNILFFVAAALTLGFTFLGNPPQFIPSLQKRSS